MKTIEKKVLSEYWDALVSGDKKGELRLDDDHAEVGDELFLREWDENEKKYTGREMRKSISHITRFSPQKTYWSEEQIREHGMAIYYFQS